MMADSRQIPAAPVWRDPDAGESVTLPLRVITPMFGGGAQSRASDDRHPIRPAAIRGHLRYWWRATVGAACADAKSLFVQEEAVWGSVNRPGRVSLEVATVSAGSSRRHGEIAPPATPQRGPLEGYFLFPFQAGKNNAEKQPEASGRENIQFKLTLTYPAELREDVERALRAWLLLGGVGSRTRRGCGALSVEDRDLARRFCPPMDKEGLRTWLVALAGPMPTTPRTWTVLAMGALVVGQPAESRAAWRQLGTFWARLRKGHFTDGHPDYNPMDGGKWRDHATLKQFYEREEEIALAKPFLGLPIIYQAFPPRGGKPASFGGTVESEFTSRMASPIVLKPVAFADGRVAPVVAVLRAPVPRAVRIDGTRVALSRPSDDPVLQSLKVQGPLEAVVMAAREHFDAPMVLVRPA